MQGAYYTAYWCNAKHPKDLKSVIRKIYEDENAPKPAVDVDKFLEQKRRFGLIG